MRASRLLVLSLALALALPGCARTPRKLAQSAPTMTQTAQAPMAEPQVIRAPVVAAPMAVAAPIIPEIPEPNAPYTLDAGDKLRVVVFGQEGLSNSYAVDASGHITMPLIGAVQARARSTESLSRAIAEKLKNGYIREPHVAVEIDPIGRSSSSARSRRPGSTPTSPT